MSALDAARDAGCCSCVWAVVRLHEGHCCVLGAADCHEPQMVAIRAENEAFMDEQDAHLAEHGIPAFLTSICQRCDDLGLTEVFR